VIAYALCHTELATESKSLGLRFRKASRARAPDTQQYGTALGIIASYIPIPVKVTPYNAGMARRDGESVAFRDANPI
jgi:hypothetical protein